jgi:hypothetical protein
MRKLKKMFYIVYGYDTDLEPFSAIPVAQVNLTTRLFNTFPNM